MWTLVSYPITKTYTSGLLSRSYLVSAACYAAMWIIPLLVLVSIGYSWDTYTLSTVKPTLQYQNHQITCLLSNNTLIYSSSFTNESYAQSNITLVGVSSSKTQGVLVSATVLKDVSACSMLLYFSTTVGNVNSLTTLPLQFATTATNSNLASVVEKGTITAKLLGSLPQSSVMTSYSNYYTSPNQQQLSMLYMGQDITRPVSLFVDIGHKVMTYSVTDPGQVTYQGIFEVPSQIVISEVSLLDNLRKFIPLLVYLMILLRLVVVDPTIRWMLQNKIYKAKYHHDKVKLH